MVKYSAKFSADFFADIAEIVLHVAETSGSSEVVRRFYDGIFDAVENRSFGADSYEKYHPYEESPDYYRIYYGNYIIFYVIDGNEMDVRRILWSGSDIPERMAE